MKIINATIPRKAKALEPANGKHKCIISYKKVGWPQKAEGKPQINPKWENKALATNFTS